MVSISVPALSFFELLSMDWGEICKLKNHFIPQVVSGLYPRKLEGFRKTTKYILDFSVERDYTGD